MANAVFLKTFVSTTIQNFKTQFQLDIKPRQPLLLQQGQQSEMADPVFIAGLIEMKSNTFTGSIALAFPKKVFLEVMSRMIGTAYTEVNEIVSSGAAELLNVIYGQAKTSLNKQNFFLGKVIPKVLTGSELDIRHPQGAKIYSIPFQSEIGLFYLEIGALHWDEAA